MKPLELEGLRTVHLRQTICRVESRSRCSKERTPATGAARSLFPVCTGRGTTHFFQSVKLCRINQFHLDHQPDRQA